MISWSLFGDSGEALGDQGGTRKPQDGLQMALQRLIDPLVAKRWPGQPGQDFGRKKAYVQGAWQDQNVVKPWQIVWFAHILCFAFWKLFGTRFGVLFGPFWKPFGTLGAPWGFQVAFQGSSEGPQRVA